MSSDGSWLLVRSDRLVVSIATPGVRYVLGRSRQLPAAQQLASKYVSNEHLCVVLSADKGHLDVYQLGKNPSFCGTACLRLKTVSDSEPGTSPSLQVTLNPDAASVSEPSPPTMESTPVTASIGPTVVGAATAAPARTDTSGAILYFPDELGLPSIAIRFEGGASHHALQSTAEDASKAALSVPQMLSVPTPAALLDDEDEDEATPARQSAGLAGQKPEWQGLLDVALQQQQQRESLATTPGQVSRKPTQPPTEPATSTTTTAATPPKRARSPLLQQQHQQHQQQPLPPHPAAHPPTKTEACDTPADPMPAKVAKTESVTPVVESPKPASTAKEEMGFWEWKCHADGKDSNPKSWRKYPLAVAKILEDAYRAKKATVDLPDRLLLNDASAPEQQCSYGVCFNEASLNGVMIQYQKKDPSRFRTIRRKGGDAVDRHGVKKCHIIPSSSSSDSDSGVDSDSDDSSIPSDSESDSD